MALSVDYLYEFGRKIIRKNQGGGLSATEFQYFWNSSQNEYMSGLLGPFQRRGGSPSGPNIGLIQNQTILTKLSPFMVSSTVTVTTGSGSKPSNYIYALGISVGDYEAKPITINQVPIIKRSVIDAPSVSNNKYYYYEYASTFKFLPATLTTSATLNYIKAPTDVVWAFTFDGDGRQVYDSVNSVQQVWDDISAREITKWMLKTIGVSFKDADFSNFGQSVINAG